MKTNNKINEVFFKLWGYLAEYKRLLIFMFFLAILGNILQLLGPYIIGKAVNTIKPNMDADSLKKLGISSFFLILSYSLGTILSLIQNMKVNKISQKVVYNMRKDSFIHLHKFSLNFFDKNSSGNIMSIIISDIDNISTSLSQITIQVMVSILNIVVALGIMFFISPMLTIIQLILLFFTMIYLRKITLISRSKMRIQRYFYGKLAGYTEEILLGQGEVKAFSYEERALKKFRRLNEFYRKNTTRALFLAGINYPSINFTGNISYLIIIIVGAFFIINDKISIGGLTSFIIYSKLFNRPIADLSDMYSVIQSVFVSAERFFNFMNQEEEVVTGSKEIDYKTLSGEISFDKVNFGYDKSKMILKDLSFKVKQGDLVAIVGPTGAGKTTIVNLIMRFYEINSGKIKLDDVDIYEYGKSSFRKLFGMVLQDTWLFTGSIKDNIAYGNEEISDEMIIEASKKACAHDFIMKLKDGYDTVISQDNNLLSHGQKQLITIARTIASNPKFLILDEATSGVDTRTEKKLQEAMKNIMEGRTSFVIAHRLSTIKSATIIIVMDKGSVVETGTHEELLKNKGFYYEMYSRQVE